MSVEDYTGLITSFHRDKPKFVATVGLSVDPMVAAADLAASMPAAFDLDLAEGKQLDAIGEWVGISRNIMIPTALPWFSFNVEGRGWGDGLWKGPLSPTMGRQALGDDDYRDILRAKIAANNWDGTRDGVKPILDKFFLSRGVDVLIQDGQDMTLIFLVPGATPNKLILSIMAGAYIPVKPMGVRTNYILPSVSSAPVFGFGTETADIAGWGTGAWGVTPDYFLT